MTNRTPIDMWPIYCARCREAIACTNGNAGIEVPIICLPCEPLYIKEADEMMAQLDRLANGEEPRR